MPAPPDATTALRASVVAALEAAPDDGPEARWDRAAWRALVADPAVLRRSTTPAHFTASAVPIDPATGRVCLVLHGRMHRWVQPGGHLDPGDTDVGGAALRELAEETGLAGTLDPAPVFLGRHRSPCGVGDWHLDVQFVVAVDEVPPRVSDESHDVAWFDLDDLPDDRAPGVGDLVARAAARLRGAGGTDGAPAGTTPA